MDTTFNTKPLDQDPEQWLRDLADLTQTLSCALTPDEPTLATVEKTVCQLHRWVQQDTNSSLKVKVAAGVGAALKSICDLKPSIERASQDNLSTIVRVLDVGDRLLQCHKVIVNQMVQSSKLGLAKSS